MQRMPIQRVLVTGGAGFIGSHTVDLLLDQNVEVVVLDDLSTGQLSNLNMRHHNLEFIEGNVLEYPYVEELVESCDAVLHLAAIVSVPVSIADPIFTFQVNTQGSLHILQAAKKASHPVRVVYASSAAVYGDAAILPCRDDIPLTAAPLSPYALQKMQVEQYADLFYRLHGVSSLGLRYFNVYGSRQDPNSPYSGVISRFVSACQQNQPITVFGDGQQSRDFIHVSDIARANWLALQSDYQGVLNVATGESCTLLQLINAIETAYAKPITIKHEAARAGDIKHSSASIELAKDRINFQAKVALQNGVAALCKN